MKKVSIITPCYNVEKYIGRYLESVLNQTYQNIELILINDGSNDNTEKVIHSYVSKFEKSNISLKYVYQENTGLGGAINHGLQLFSGDYLCWPDPDDYLTKDSIEKKVHFLEENQEYAVVTSNAYIFDESNLKKPIGIIANNRERFDTYQFEHLINERSIFCPGCHMIRTSHFLKVNPQKQIYPAKRGQNWQMLLPLYYHYKRGFIDEPLYNYVIYSNSMSRGDNTLEKNMYRLSEHENILINTLNQINMNESDRIKYLNYVSLNRYPRKKLYIAWKYKNLQLFESNYNILKQNNNLNLRDRILFLRMNFNKMYDRVKNYKHVI